MMGLSATMKWFEPLTESIEDIEAAERTRAVYVSYTPLSRFFRRVMHTFCSTGATTWRRHRKKILTLHRFTGDGAVPLLESPQR